MKGRHRGEILPKIELGDHQRPRVLAKDRLTTGGLLHTYSMTVPNEVNNGITNTIKNHVLLFSSVPV